MGSTLLYAAVAECPAEVIQKELSLDLLVALERMDERNELRESGKISENDGRNGRDGGADGKGTPARGGAAEGLAYPTAA